MKIFNFFLVIFSFFLCSNSLLAQERFKKAYVIDNNQRIINGSIDFGNPIRNPNEIIFLDSSTLRISIFKPTDIQAFSVMLEEERRYESRIVQITDYPKYVEDLDDSGISDIITDTVFVEVLVKGKASLFHYKDEEKWDHFFCEKDGVFQTLVQTLTRHDMITKDVLVLRQRYKMQLQQLFFDCSSILERIKAVENTIPALQRIFEDYNNCSGNENEFIKNRKTSQHTKFAFNVGLRMTKLYVSDVKIGGAANIEKLDFKSPYRLPIGMSIDIPLSKKTNKYSLYNELLYTKFRARGGYSLGQESYFLTFRYTYIQYLIAFRYHFKENHSTFSPFVNIGGTMSYGLSSSEAILTTSYYYIPQQVISTQKSLLIPKLFPFSTLCGFGINHKQYSLELRVSYNTGISYHDDMKSNVLAGCLMMTYSPGRK
jgi:hypothetical protein